MNSIFDLTGMKAIVTGGGKGLGRGIAEGFLEQGAEVVLIGSSDAAFETKNEFRQKGYKVHAVKGDFLSREDRARAFDEAIQLLGGTIDILVNNAAINFRMPTDVMSLEKIDEVLEINLTAVIDLCQRAFPYMKGKGYGKIINIGSLSSYRSAAKNTVGYQASKAGVRQIIKLFADEWSEYGIRTNGVAPGWVKTNMTEAIINDPKKYADTIAHIPLGRWATPDDFKGITILLASHAGDFINGTMIPVDGGYLAR